jgi:hypothetical protein
MPPLTPPFRPMKTGNVRTYVEEVEALAPADAPILAPEVDADLDVAYGSLTELVNAVNGLPTTYPPSGAASGSLAGSYPAPSIAPSAVRGTPSAGGTAREIAKASIWAADDLIDASITDAKIAALAAPKLTGTIAQARLPVAPSGLVTANLNDGAVARTKIAADAWLPPVPSAGDVSKVLGVTAGPALTYVAPPGGPPTGAAGGDLAGSTYPNPVVKAGAITAAKLAADAVNPGRKFLRMGDVGPLVSGTWTPVIDTTIVTSADCWLILLFTVPLSWQPVNSTNYILETSLYCNGVGISEGTIQPKNIRLTAAATSWLPIGINIECIVGSGTGTIPILLYVRMGSGEPDTLYVNGASLLAMALRA